MALLLALQLLGDPETVEIKPGAQIADIMWEGAVKIEAALKIVAPDVDCVITSRFDGLHSENSLHYKGLALDFRTRDLTFGQQHIWVALCEEALGPHWDVVLEKDHLHVEFDPKG